ncbi:MAG: glutathione synthase [bacterium]|nr:glutathione synthase [bacterium]
MRHLFIVDPLSGLNPTADTTVVFMREAAKRGHSIATCEVSQLSIGSDGQSQSGWVETLLASGNAWYELGESGFGPLSDFDVVWMRKDPPYDLDFFFVTHLLSLTPRTTLVTNDPHGLREVTEKLFVLRYPDLCPETLISRNIAELEAFRARLGGEMIIKPLDGCGGEGVFHLTPDDRNTKTILETATRHGTLLQIAQAYIPEVRDGDKRIILVEGEPIGAVLRVPQRWETRSNFHVGGTAQKSEISARDREICERLRPALLEYGILFAGIDVIGDRLTEVNVTSPTGIQEINQLDGVELESRVLDAVEARLVSQRGEI